jgi:hypothetical protein
MKKLFILFILILPVFYSQGQDSRLSPLLIYKNGDGRVAPFENGRMLVTGRRYHMLAVPDRRYEFSSWQEVDVFTFTQYEYDENGERIEPPTVSTDVTLMPQHVDNPYLTFTMEPESLIIDSTNLVVTESIGWQANFVPRSR